MRALFQADRLIGAVFFFFFVGEKIAIPSRFWKILFDFIWLSDNPFLFITGFEQLSSRGSRRPNTVTFSLGCEGKWGRNRAERALAFGFRRRFEPVEHENLTDSDELDLHPGQFFSFSKIFCSSETRPFKVLGVHTRHAHHHHRLQQYTHTTNTHKPHKRPGRPPGKKPKSGSFQERAAGGQFGAKEAAAPPAEPTVPRDHDIDTCYHGDEERKGAAVACLPCRRFTVRSVLEREQCI